MIESPHESASSSPDAAPRDGNGGRAQVTMGGPVLPAGPEPVPSTKPETLSYAPAGGRRRRRRWRLAALIGVAVLVLGVPLVRYINVISLLPSSLLLRLQVSRFDSIWPPATIELDRRCRADELSAAEATQFDSNTFFVEVIGPQTVTKNRAFELGLRLTPRTPGLARALQRRRGTSVSQRYHLEDIALTQEDGTPFPAAEVESFVGDALDRCVEIGASPQTYGWPVTFRRCGRFRACLSGKLMVGCSMHEICRMIPFSLIHEFEVTEQSAASSVPLASDQALDARIRSAFESLSCDDDGRIKLDCGQPDDGLCEVTVFARRPDDEAFVRLPAVPVFGKQAIRLPRAWLTDPSWKEDRWIELKATGGWTLPRWEFLGFRITEARWRYWDSELTRHVRLRTGGTPQEKENERDGSGVAHPVGMGSR